MCDAPVDDVVAPSKVISDSFVTSNVVKKIYTALYSDNNIVYFNENYGDVEEILCREDVFLLVPT